MRMSPCVWTQARRVLREAGTHPELTGFAAPLGVVGGVRGRLTAVHFNICHGWAVVDSVLRWVGRVVAAFACRLICRGNVEGLQQGRVAGRTLGWGVCSMSGPGRLIGMVYDIHSTTCLQSSSTHCFAPKHLFPTTIHSPQTSNATNMTCHRMMRMMTMTMAGHPSPGGQGTSRSRRQGTTMPPLHPTMMRSTPWRV